ncbi:MAG: BolA family protein [Gammaproteobacteria bacterium]
MTTDRIALITDILTNALSPATLNIIDESAKHAGHAGAKGGGGHFIVEIVSDAFEEKSLIQRHRLVYDALGDAMQTEIHALSIKANTQAELINH